MSDGSADDLPETPRPIQRMLDHYGFVDDPFGEAVDAKAFSGAGNRSRAASQVVHLFKLAASECLLIAPAEGGKRTLARHIVEQLGSGWCVAWVDGREIYDAFDLIGELFGQLGLAEDAGGMEVEDTSPIGQLVARRFEGGEHCLLVLQHAEKLTPETQRWLRSQGRQDGQPEMGLRQLWLAESAESIDQADDEHQWTSITLDPLSDAEALEYLQDRFAAAGRSRRLPIEQHDVAWLNHVAGGWPGPLNRAARDYLVDHEKKAIQRQPAAGRQPTAERQPRARWRTSAGLLYALIGVLVLVAASVLTVRYLSAPSETTTADRLAPDALEPARDEGEPDLARNEPDAGSQQSVPDSGPASDSTDEGDEVALAPDQESIEIDTAMVDPEPARSGDDTAAVDAESVPLETDVVDPEPAPPDADTATVDAEPATPDAGVATIDTEPIVSGDDGAGVEDAGEPSGYTVQIAGGRTRENVAKLGSELAARLDTDMARITLDGRPWYVLISGRHDSVEQARAAIADLPPEVRSRSPWPRPLSELEVLESTGSAGQPPIDGPDPGAVTAGQDNGGVAAREAPYTLQVVGVRDRGSLEALVAELDNPERYEIVSTTFEGQPWYVLTHGRYETAETARSDIGQLPQDLRRYEPWPRPWSELQ